MIRDMKTEQMISIKIAYFEERGSLRLDFRNVHRSEPWVTCRLYISYCFFWVEGVGYKHKKVCMKKINNIKLV